MRMEPVPFDWCSFYALFWNDKGIKCKINIPDTVLFRYGQLSAWWSTNKQGSIQRHTSQSTSLEAIRKRFLSVAQQDDSNYSKFVAVSWLGSGKPQLLRVMAFNQLCELLSDRLESGRQDEAPEIETPSVLQAFIQPWQDLRYVTTYINAGTTVTCHTFQRKYSRRYTPMSAATAAQVDNRDADIITATGAEAHQRVAEIEANQGVVEPSLKMHLRKLTAHLVKYIQRAHGLTLGSVVCEYIRDADGKIYLMSVLRTEWTSNASGHGAGSLNAAVLQAPVVELRELDEAAGPQKQGADTQGPGEQGVAQGNLEEEDGEEDDMVEEDEGDDEFGPLPTTAPPAQQIQSARPMSALPESSARQPSPSSERGRSSGGDAWAQQPMSTASAGGAGSSELVRQYSGTQGAGVSAADEGMLVRPMTARPVSRGAPGEALTPTTTASRASLIQYPGGASRSAGQGLAVTNTWPSQQHDAALTSIPPSPSSSVPRVRSAMLPPSPAHSANTRPVSSPGPRSTGKPPSARSVSPGAAPGGAPLGFGSTTHRPSHVSPDRPYVAHGLSAAPSAYPPVPGGVQPPAVGTLTSRGAHVNGSSRGAPLLLAQLQKENEVLRDQLVYQHELAEASAAKVRVLEREAHVVTTTFDNRKHELQHVLACTKQELESVKADRDRWQQRAVEAEARASDMEHESNSLKATISADRETTMAALREYQTREQQQSERLEQLEAEVLRLSSNLKMETTAVNSLKRQLVEFSDIAERNKNTLRDADLDPALVEVMNRAGYLLNSQANPTGEQYAIQKIFQHYSSDLRSVFLFYCQLEQSFADHWPPSMGFPNWMLFCRDSETSDPRAGARVRSSQHFKMLPPSQCEELFSKFSRRDESSSLSGKADSVLSYESFLCCVLAAAAALQRPDVPFLSEGLREYILRYLARAKRVTPQGLGRGMLRSAVEGTRASPSMLSDARQQGAAPSAGAAPGEHEDGGGARKKRGKSAAGSVKSGAASRQSSRPPSATPARLLNSAGNSTVMKELALLSLSSPTANRELLRTGGGFSLA